MDEILKRLTIAKKNLEILESISPGNSKAPKLMALENKIKIKNQKKEIANAKIKNELSILKKANENIEQLIKISESANLKKLENEQPVIKENWSPKSPSIPTIDPANTELIRLAMLSGTYGFQTIQIIGNTIPEIWCPEIRSKVDPKDLPIIPVNRGGTGATDIVTSRNNLGLGTLSTQDSSSVAISGGQITIDGQFNTGVQLSPNSYSTAKMSIRSAIIDFTVAGVVEIFTIPLGYFFLIDEIEVITLSILSPGAPPLFTFGNNISTNAYYGPGISKSNSIESRHVIQSPQNPVAENTTIIFNIQEASTAQSHTGVGIVNGYLISAV